MAFFSFVYQNGLWISVPVFILAAVLLGFCIRHVIRVVKRTHILRVPLRHQQEIEFGKAGRVLLCLQGPRLSSRFAHLEYELLGPDGMSIEGRRTWFRLRTSGVASVRMTERSYRVSEPGRHILQIKGLRLDGTADSDSDHWIVFMSPHLAGSIGGVIGMVLAGLLLIGSLVLFFLRLAGEGS